MMEMVEANWLLLLIAFLIGLAIAWYVFHAKRTTRVTRDRRDVLDEGAERAGRNQALIDTAPVSKDTVTGIEQPDPPPPATPVVTPAGVAGAGSAVSAATLQAQPPPPPPVDNSADTEITRTDYEDDLTRIKGVGPKLSVRLKELGVISYQQIAEWTDADIDRIDSQLGRFEGRIRRDSWVEQARMLATGNAHAYEEKFGKL